jgi:hypothetical protein
MYVKKIKNFITKNETWLLYVIVGIAFLLHFFFSTRGFYSLITDSHAFRRTQTAITAYYFVKDGFRIDYLTPILLRHCLNGILGLSSKGFHLKHRRISIHIFLTFLCYQSCSSF